MKMFRFRSFVAVALVCFLSSCERPVGSDVAATVNGRPISYTALDRAMAIQFPQVKPKTSADETETVHLRLEVLRVLIDQEVMMQRAEKEGLLASDADVEAKFNDKKAGYTKEELEKELEKKKMTEADFKAELRRELSVDTLFRNEIGSRISISDADIASYYRANKAEYNVPENSIHLAVIFVSPVADPNVMNLKNSKAQNDQQAREKMQMIEGRLREGEDFATLAANFSEDPSTSSNGGDAGFILESQLEKGANPELRKAIFNMMPGQVSKIIPTPDGYRIIKLISKQQAGQRPLDDPRVQEQIRTRLFQTKDQMLRDAFYEMARSEAKIVNYYAKSILDKREKK